MGYVQDNTDFQAIEIHAFMYDNTTQCARVEWNVVDGMLDVNDVHRNAPSGAGMARACSFKDMLARLASLASV